MKINKIIFKKSSDPFIYKGSELFVFKSPSPTVYQVY